MKIVINAQGTQGDVRPMLALAITLRRAGFEVETCAPVNFDSLFTQNGFVFHPVGGDTQKFMEQTKEQMNNPLKLALSMARVLQEEITEQFSSLSKVVKGADLLVSGGLDFVGRSIAEYYDIPYRLVLYTPLSFKSRFHAPVTIPFQKRPGWMNRVCWWGNELMGEKIFGLRKINNLNRKQLGLGVVPHLTDYTMEEAIVAADPVLAPMPSDIRAKYIQTGFWQLDEELELDNELVNFIEAGSPPVYIGFGSMTDPAPTKTASILQELIEQNRFRLIIAKGWAKLGVNGANQNTFMVDYVPHAKLFPKMAAIVHHGGAGTTHTAAKAGVPQVIVPHAFDQYYWGERIYNLKIGPKPLNRAQLSGQKLMMLIEQATANPDIQRRAREIGDILYQKDGLRETLNHLKILMSSQPKK